jgi:hypothetical protein
MNYEWEFVGDGRCCIYCGPGTNKWLCKDGKMHGSGDDPTFNMYYWNTKKAAKEFRDKWLEVEKLEVREDVGYNRWYISRLRKQDPSVYLRKDGTTSLVCGIKNFWRTRQEAEEFLEQWKKSQFTTKETKMDDLSSKLAQAEIDKKSIEDNINKIKAETGVYERGCKKYFLGYADKYLTLYGLDGHWEDNPFKVKHSGSYINGKVRWRIVEQSGVDLMKNYTYIGDL